MLATPNELYSELSGSMKKYEMYARRNVYNPETRILQHKPNRKNGGYDLPRLFWPWLYGECLREEYQTSP